MLKPLLKMSVALFLLGKSATALDAPTAMVPAGLNPGDTFYIMFATSGTTTGNLAAGTDYTNFANAQADLNSTKGTDDASITWGAWFAHNDGTTSTASLFAADNTRPIYNLNGDKVADDYADLTDGSLDNAIKYYQDGTESPGAVPVWTGTDADGTAASTLSNGGNSTYGLPRVADNTWASIGTAAGTTAFQLYAVSPLLTVPASSTVSSATTAPIGPFGLLALLLGILGFGGWSIRKRG